MTVTNLFLWQAAEPDLISTGIGVVLVVIFLSAIFNALRYGISGLILGAIIGPVFLEVSVQEGMIGGAIVFALIGFFAGGED
ncbi:MAG: hypothetical protein KDC44_15215 [Phaeodactylibacter sp.]|nr:hypothetical protein [Phaeodactylibacter sp.]